MSEVCVILSNSKESSEEQKKTFLKYADIFGKFAKFYNQRKIKPSGLQSMGKLDILTEPENSADTDGESFVGAGDLQDKNSSDVKLMEVKMEKKKEKSKADILREEKKARELEKQKREKLIHEIMDKISSLGKSYEERVFEVAVGRWKMQKTERRSAEREIAEAQRKLEEVKRRYSK
ncbi:MAG: hypothetical protein ACFFG0_03275 [Candidatus Thorarchaeota archaeon]